MDTPLRPQTVADGVSWFPALTPTLPPATHTNSYALGSRQVLLVEPATPFDDERRAWIEWARGIASEGRELLAIIATHHHSDHVGGAEFLCSELGLPLWAHAKTAALTGLPVARELSEDDELVLDGPTPQRWRCLHTPGHAPGHVCLFEPSLKVLVVGDMVASVGTILIDPADGDLTAYLEQLERLASIDAVRALPAHGAPIDPPEPLFRHYIAHRLMRERKVVDALDETPQSIEALLPKVYDDAPQYLWPLAALSLESHLIKLVADGRATDTDGWVLSKG